MNTAYLDQARHDFARYLSRTLTASQRFGGRYNPPGEFGALYTATDEDTGWEEVAHRFRREGVEGLPPDMGVLRIVIGAGRYADLTTDVGRGQWNVSRGELTSAEPDDRERDACWQLGRDVRAVADALMAPSARGSGVNMPLFPDRNDGELKLTLGSAAVRHVPAHLAQQPNEEW